MRPMLAISLTAALCSLGLASNAHAVANPGTPAPLFDKNQLQSGMVGAPWFLNQQTGKVVILHMLGWN
ncbi:MAG: hypothetical protein HOP12_16240 [Candidatus Eisenbacteria bacterium]|uniref:Redoxin domain-containing protein n=1 Tax=Eiseniibacteriota bacterium TaxID=2212470 RepID=A0A849SMM9_UNCEI|nr:hypothetical protein [Candidatus Eisenbacteria bacterium]